MIRTLAILCLVAAPAFGLWEKGYKVRFDLTTGIGKTAFIPHPTTYEEAYGLNWVNMTKPPVPAGYEGLELVCRQGDYTLCMLYDDTGYLAGSQIAFQKDRYTGALFDWTDSGFQSWSVAENDTIYEYYTITQYYGSPEFYASSKETRLAARSSDYILQDANIYVDDFGGILRKIPISVPQIISSGNYTEQGCMVGMGLHYYYLMTESTTCEVDTLSRWFLIVYAGQLVGIGFNFSGKYTVPEGYLNPFESPNRAAIKLIVPNGPECMYAYGDTGMVTMHTFFIKDPYFILCQLNLG